VVRRRGQNKYVPCAHHRPLSPAVHMSTASFCRRRRRRGLRSDDETASFEGTRLPGSCAASDIRRRVSSSARYFGGGGGGGGARAACAGSSMPRGDRGGGGGTAILDTIFRVTFAIRSSPLLPPPPPPRYRGPVRLDGNAMVPSLPSLPRDRPPSIRHIDRPHLTCK